MNIQKRRINIDVYIQTWLPQHKRQPNRLMLFRLLLTPLKLLMADFLVWRDAFIQKAYITNETISMEWYLNELYDDVSRRIYIQTNDAVGVDIGLAATEPTEFKDVGLIASEPADFMDMPLIGEDPDIGFYNFAVFIPSSLAPMTNEIASIVKQKKLAGKTFTIITF